MSVERCLNIIGTALSNIENSYFRLGTTYSINGIVRERVFCYELYHQMRLLEPEGYHLTLNGEVDKRGHTEFHRNDRKNPDFVFHIPGDMQGNTVVCEVKGVIRNSRRDIVKDLETLSVFIRNYQYSAGVFILYNHSLEELEEYIEIHNEEISLVTDGVRDLIHIYVLRQPNSVVVTRMLSEIIVKDD